MAKEKIYKVYFNKSGIPRLIPANLRSFELIPTGVCQDAKAILKTTNPRGARDLL